ncbi:MAG: family 78 glycoside hydrolase catalytic domain [Clostridia bacterium]|nr:family 78 glycoside hydrolase catalytic domain [Clostridia bacterium]
MKILLTVDGKQNAIGVNRERVRLSLKTDGLLNFDKIEYAVYASEKDVLDKKPMILCTGKNYVEYIDGKEFSDRKEYFCQAKVYYKKSVYESSVTKFETGIKSENFVADWICDPEFDDLHVSEFTKQFTIESAVKKARLIIVGLGYYMSFINGNKTDEEYYKPVLTDFDIRDNLLNNPWYKAENFRDNEKTVCYDVYDVTNLIKTGDNAINVLLGTGWYCDEDKLITDPSFSFGKPKLIFELHVETEKGDILVKSDVDCKVRTTNIISQHFACDTIDFTLEEKPFRSVAVGKAPSGRLVANVCENDKVIEKLSPVAVTENNGVTEYDFGVNHSGGIKMTVKGKRGAKLVINQYETKKDGVLNPLTSRWDAYKDGKVIIGHLDQTCTYILSGGEDVIEPYFHWSCYRYATVECDGEYEIKQLQSLFISTAVEKDGLFYCDDDFLNELYNAFISTQRDNMHSGVPSDCPHREKLPYTGDGQLVIEPTLYTLDAENFYRKWFKDILDAQGKDGYVPNSAPYMGGDGGYWWTNSLINVTDVLYKYTGDKKVIEDAYSHVIKLVEYYDRIKQENGIVHFVERGWGLGDWLTPEVTVLNKDFMNTLAVYFAVNKAQEFSAILGVNLHDEFLSEFKTKLVNAINANFFDKEKQTYADGVQGADILPLLFGICEKEYAPNVAKNLIAKYKKDTHFDTGIVLTPRLLDLLVELRESRLAYDILTEKTGPSYCDMLKGETTLPEHWFKHWPGNPNSYVSHCHPMFGSVIAWMIKHVAGLDLSNLCNKKITFAPKVIDRVKVARAEKQTVYGKVSISYCAEDGFSMKVVVPFGVTGEIILPSSIKKITINDLPVVGTKCGEYTSFTVSGGEYAVRGG